VHNSLTKEVGQTKMNQAVVLAGARQNQRGASKEEARVLLNHLPRVLPKPLQAAGNQLKAIVEQLTLRVKLCQVYSFVDKSLGRRTLLPKLFTYAYLFGNNLFSVTWH
jgi:hypothetical protein